MDLLDWITAALTVVGVVAAFIFPINKETDRK
ncbi:MAG: hypothetical protein V7606_1134, partial [Burkholderiales bacterium]|nr:hypothetical protein [Burkholderia sp.]